MRTLATVAAFIGYYTKAKLCGCNRAHAVEVAMLSIGLTQA